MLSLGYNDKLLKIIPQNYEINNTYNYRGIKYIKKNPVYRDCITFLHCLVTAYTKKTLYCAMEKIITANTTRCMNLGKKWNAYKYSGPL